MFIFSIYVFVDQVVSTYEAYNPLKDGFRSCVVVRWNSPQLPNECNRSGPTVPTYYAAIGELLVPFYRGYKSQWYGLTLGLELDDLKNSFGYESDRSMNLIEEKLFAQWGIESFKNAVLKKDFRKLWSTKPYQIESCQICYVDQNRNHLNNVLWKCCGYHGACIHCLEHLKICPICKAPRRPVLSLLSNVTL